MLWSFLIRNSLQWIHSEQTDLFQKKHALSETFHLLTKYIHYTELFYNVLIYF